MNALIEEARVAVHIVWRRRWLALGVAWGVALAGWLVVSLIPNSYRSTARVYVEPQSILPAAVGISQNDQQQGVEAVKQSLLSRDVLAQVIRRTDLAPQAATPAMMAGQVARLQKAVEIKSTQDDLYDISATLSGGGLSDGQNARLAQQIVARLVDLFAAGSATGNADEARRSLAFLDAQLATRGTQLQAAEQKRVAFEQQFMGMLPGSGSIEDRMAAARAQLADVDSNLAAAQSAAAAIGGQLAATPATIPAPVSGGGTSARDRYASLQAQLAADQAQGWTDQHPDVVALKGQIARLAGAAAHDTGGGATQPNPSYASLQAMAADKRATASALAVRRAQLQGDMTRFRSIQASQPEVTAQQAKLSRDYDVLKSAYDKLLADREGVKLRTDAQAQAGSVDVRVIAPATMSRVPVKPMRPLLVTGVLLLALGGGAGVAWARAKLTTSYSTPTALASASGLPVLGSIGYVPGARQQARAAQQMKWFAGVGGGLAATWLLLLVVEFVQRGLTA